MKFVNYLIGDSDLESDILQRDIIFAHFNQLSRKFYLIQYYQKIFYLHVINLSIISKKDKLIFNENKK